MAVGLAGGAGGAFFDCAKVGDVSASVEQQAISNDLEKFVLMIGVCGGVRW